MYSCTIVYETELNGNEIKKFLIDSEYYPMVFNDCIHRILHIFRWNQHQILSIAIKKQEINKNAFFYSRNSNISLRQSYQDHLEVIEYEFC